MKDELNERATALLSAAVAPALAMDGLSVEVVSVEGGTARVRLRGASVTCPASVWAVHSGIAEALQPLGVEHLVVVS